MFVPCIAGGEAVDKVSATSGSAAKFEEGLGTTEEDASAVAEETGQQPDGLYQTNEALFFFAA